MSAPTTTTRPSLRAWLVMLGIVLAVFGTVAVLVATSSADTDSLPACRLAYMVDDDTMVVPQLDSDGFVIGYDTQQCEPSR